MSCATCRKNRDFKRVFNLAQLMVEQEQKTYVIINGLSGYDFTTIEDAIARRKKIIKILPYN